MPSFDSSITNRRFPGQQLKEFDVPDESQQQQQVQQQFQQQQPQQQTVVNYSFGDLEAQSQKFSQSPAEIEAQIRAAKEAKKVGRERLGDGARKRIEMLIGMTKITREVILDENVYVLKSLTSKEVRDSITAAAGYDGTVEAPFEVRRQFLARALTHISGVELEDFIGSNSLDSKLMFLDELDHTLLNRLYDEYLLLNNEVVNKYSIKTVEEAKEVMEDLKK